MNATGYTRLTRAERFALLAALQLYVETPPWVRKMPRYKDATAVLGDRPLTDDGLRALRQRIGSEFPDVQYADECPRCGDDDAVEGGPVDICGEAAVQDCSCSACGASWVLTFGLARVTMTEG